MCVWGMSSFIDIIQYKHGIEIKVQVFSTSIYAPGTPRWSLGCNCGSNEHLFSYVLTRVAESVRRS